VPDGSEVFVSGYFRQGRHPAVLAFLDPHEVAAPPLGELVTGLVKEPGLVNEQAEEEDDHADPEDQTPKLHVGHERLLQPRTVLRRC
jgi:hypothetical protein